VSSEKRLVIASRSGRLLVLVREIKAPFGIAARVAVSAGNFRCGIAIIM
jgi:hypothetical protein